MRIPRRTLVLASAAAVIAAVISTTLPMPAHGCSCAMPSDIQAWVGESEAAFVGTLIDRRDGPDGQFGEESIYVFEVEEWVKGDAGEVIEVRSASNGAACGFEFWDEDMRIGAVIYEDNGQLHGGLCAQIDPDVLLAAVEAPVKSATGVGYLLAANGFNSTRMTVLDEAGHLVAELQAPASDEFSGTQHLDVCPGREMMLQTTSSQVVVWDMARLEIVASHEIPVDDHGWPADVACLAPDASLIWMVRGFEASSELIEVAPEHRAILELPGPTGSIGNGFVVAQASYEGDAFLVDPATGEETRLTETPANALHGVYATPHPSQNIVAVVETRFSTGDETSATLTIFDGTGTVVKMFEIPWETYAPTWLDDERVAVTAYDWSQDDGRQIGYVFNVATAERVEIEGWEGTYAVADGGTVYTVDGGTIVEIGLDSGSGEHLATLASQSAGPLVLLDHSEPFPPPVDTVPETEPAPTPTVPPLVAPELGAPRGDGVVGSGAEPATGYVQWVAGVAIFSFLGVLAWLATHKPTHG